MLVSLYWQLAGIVDGAGEMAKAAGILWRESGHPSASRVSALHAIAKLHRGAGEEQLSRPCSQLHGVLQRHNERQWRCARLRVKQRLGGLLSKSTRTSGKTRNKTRKFQQWLLRNCV